MIRKLRMETSSSGDSFLDGSTSGGDATEFFTVNSTSSADAPIAAANNAPNRRA
jgi:hypothetical protein